MLRRSVTILLVTMSLACARGPDTPVAGSAGAHQFFNAGLDTLDRSLASLAVALDTADSTTAEARSAFRTARRGFKRIEALLTYYIPVATGTINGPRMEGDDDDPDPPPKSAPIGFQVIEDALFAGSVPMQQARAELAAMRRTMRSLQSVAAGNPIEPRAALDAARLQLARVATLSVAGIDAEASGDALLEAAESLEGTNDLLLTFLQDPATRDSVDLSLRKAAAELRAAPDFNAFDRLHFIVASVLPAGRALIAAQAEAGVPDQGVRRFWRETAGTPFEADAFSAHAFPPAYAVTPTREIEALGRRLFGDPRLSGNGTRSCATCHQPSRAFMDGMARPVAMRHDLTVSRNTPTLLNVAMQPAFFADDRALSLEDQVATVLASEAEMGSSAEEAAGRLSADPACRDAFARAFPDRADSTVTGMQVRQVVAAYLRTLVALDSRFDRAVRGDTLALTMEERSGFNVFMGKGRCGTCHFTPLFNGLTPPFYRTSEAEIIGVPAGPDLDHAELDPDIGRANVEETPLNRFAFKVTSLRNVALTAPNMHNGVFRTLEDVIAFYDRGGGAGIGLDLPFQSLPAARLNLTPEEKRALVAFLGSLTDTIPRAVRDVR